MDFGFLANSIGIKFVSAILAVLVVLFFAIRKRKLLKQLKVRPLITRRSTAVFILVLLLVSIASLRPFFGKEEFQVPSKYSTIIAAVDVSDSMLARDVFPSRIEAVKRKLFDLVNYIKSQGKPYKIGIVLFAGSAYSFCPVTKDLEVITNYIRSIDNKLIETGGSDIELGAKASIAALKAAKASSGQILLLTDGEDEELSKSGLTNTLAELDVRFGVLGFGESEPTTIIKNGRPLRGPNGNVIKSSLNESLLNEIAEQNGGAYSKYTLNDSDLRKTIFARAGDNPQQVDDSIVAFNEYSWLISMFVLLLILASLAFKRLIPVHFIFLIAVFFSDIPIALAQSSPADAAKLYLEQDFESSEKVFEALSTKTPDNSRYTRAWGNALYRQQKFDQAESAFRAASSDAKTGRDAFSSNFNLGNALFMQQRFDEAIEAYEKALKNKPKDEKTEFNIELAKKMLEQQKQEEQQEKQQQEQEEQQQQEQKQQNQQEENQDQQSQQDSSQEQDSEEQESEDGSSEKEQNQKDQEEQNDGKEGQNKEQDQQENQSQPEETQEQSQPEEVTGSLKEQEAKAWLDSLSESPLLLRRDGFKGTPRRQTW